MKKAIFIAILGILDVAIFCKMLWGDTGLIEVQTLKDQYKILKLSVQKLDQENQGLSREIRLMQSDNAYAEKMIRQKLHYLRDNEIVYLFSDESVSKGANSNERKN